MSTHPFDSDAQKHDQHMAASIASDQAKSLQEILDKTGMAMKALLGSLTEIDGLIQKVRDVASKTDLLALNASIEAARAGQSGKGFAVVADEVGRLSEKVQQAVGAVEVSCSGIRKSAELVALGIEKSQAKVTESK